MRGLSKQPCGAPVLSISEVEMFPTFTNWVQPVRKSRPRQEVQAPIALGGFETQGLKLNDKLGGSYGVDC